jgi:hypothetical protein
MLYGCSQAIQHGHKPTIILLLQHGADVYATNIKASRPDLSSRSIAAQMKSALTPRNVQTNKRHAAFDTQCTPCNDTAFDPSPRVARSRPRSRVASGRSAEERPWFT